MNVNAAYHSVKLNGLLDAVRKRHPLPAEFIRADHTENISRIMNLIEPLKDNMISKFALTLKPSELDYVLMAQAKCADERVCGMLSYILEKRFRKRLYELNLVMLQADYENKNLLNSMAKMVKCLQSKYPEDYASSIFAALDKGLGGSVGASCSSKIPETIHSQLLSEQTSISLFYEKYSMDAKSTLAKKVSELFFLNCVKEGFLNNRAVFTDFIKRLDAASAAPIISRYLNMLEAQEHFDELNGSLSERYGEPWVNGTPADERMLDFWSLLPEASLKRFESWQGLKKIEAHFNNGSEVRFWISYLDEMKRVFHYAANRLLFLDFGKFVVVDAPDELSEGFPLGTSSYIYDRTYFDAEFERYKIAAAPGEGRTVWRIIPEHVFTPRDLIIKDIKSEVYSVGYKKVQLLYAKEIMEMMLGDSR